jgi:polyisoprenoid-binding protein YceI
MSHRLAMVLALATLGLSARTAGADDLLLRLEPAKTKVGFTVEATGHDVHGTLSLQEGVVRFDPASGAASGRIVIDARRAETGNDSRDKTLHQKVLESTAFPSFVFVPQRLEGRVPDQGAADVVLVGTLSIHGSEHPLRLPAHVELRDGALAARVAFPVPYVDWGLHNPSLFVLRVADEVTVNVEAQGSLGPAPPTIAGGRGGR